MTSLHDLQTGLRRAILEGDTDAIAATIAADGIAPAARLGIHINHVFATLTEGLATTFPVVRRLVGERFFEGLAAGFIRGFPPRDPRLALWGAAFPRFVRGAPACRALPYLGGVARLEWTMRVSRRSPVGRPLDPAAILAVAAADQPRLALRLDPSLRYVVSRWPILAIWQANQSAGEVPAVRLDQPGGTIELRREGDGVAMARIRRVDAAFRRALRRGLPLLEATEAALDVDPHFDLAAAIRGLFAGGYVVRLAIVRDPTRKEPDQWT